MARLKSEFKVITMDIRGHGNSDKPTNPAAYAIETMCDDILLVADACNVEKFALWGFSYGGNIGRYLAPNVQIQIIDGLNHVQEFEEIDRVFPTMLAFTKS